MKNAHSAGRAASVYGMSDTAYVTALSTSQVCAATGLTYRQLDYWVRCGAIEPAVSRASGSGSVRRWAPEQLRQLRFAAVLTTHGAELATVRPALIASARIAEQAWDTRVLVTIDGRICTLLGADADGWVVDLAACHLSSRMAA